MLLLFTVTVPAIATITTTGAGFAREALGVAGSSPGDGARASGDPLASSERARGLPRDGSRRAVRSVCCGGRGAGLPPWDRSRSARGGSGVRENDVLVVVVAVVVTPPVLVPGDSGGRWWW